MTDGPELRPAATVMLLRDALDGGIEVLMVRRAVAAAFAGGIYVFPGGAVDAADRTPEIGALVSGLDDVAACRAGGLGRGSDRLGRSRVSGGTRAAHFGSGPTVGAASRGGEGHDHSHLRPAHRRLPMSPATLLGFQRGDVRRGIAAHFPRCTRQDSNLRTRLRRPMLYPLSYEGRDTRVPLPCHNLGP